ncbi:two-component system sensor histidine kinase DesK [Thermocatellispora tengchongensis]|uniref:Two-component system sensor histidine kinase DesK n=1 Tax=Thermocatellispora tengchongensis TaxID=1073253 RepID=A0A840P9F7_9ACTN|nr:sensor histidine kinase [Thermocatellispora tengchongensis]MBB5138014.1 two-component system sensor histidine kinase DesK [Thermocatellispora tengchongensis]
MFGAFGRGKRSDFERVRLVTKWSLAGALVAAWVGLFGGVALAVEQGTASVVVVAAGGVGVVAFSVLYWRVIQAAVEERPARWEIWALGAVTVALLLLPDAGPFGWGMVGAAWASAAILHVNAARAWLVCGGTAVVCALLASGDDSPAFTLVPYGLLCLALPWANRFQLWFWQVVRAADDGKRAQAALAVTAERLRFARDLHDLVGHSLSAIAVKSEVATKLATSDGERAAAEMAEVRRLARETLQQIRAAVRGYRTVDLRAELLSVRAVLEAGGIRCSLRAPDAELPQDVSTLLAWVVREGTTNVLRHSAASRCRIEVTAGDGAVVLEMANDGVRDGAREAGEGRGEGRGEEGIAAPGSGIAGMAERVAALGGVLRAGPGHRPGEFLLTVTVPVAVPLGASA